MTAPIQGYRIESFVPEHLAADQDFHIAMRRRLEDLMQMQGFEQTTRVEVRVLSSDELDDCPLRPGFKIVEAFVDVNEYDVEVPMPGEVDPVRLEAGGAPEPYEPMPESQDVRIDAPVVSLQHGVSIATTERCTTCGNPVSPHPYRHPITTIGGSK